MFFSVFLLPSGEKNQQRPLTQKKTYVIPSRDLLRIFRPKDAKIQPPSTGITWQTGLPGLVVKRHTTTENKAIFPTT